MVDIGKESIGLLLSPVADWPMRSGMVKDQAEWQLVSRILTAISGWPIDAKQMYALRQCLELVPVDKLEACAKTCEQAKKLRPRKEEGASGAGNRTD